MLVISWNVRGVGSTVKRKEIRKMLRQQRVEMVFLVETKVEVVSEVLIRSIWWTDSFSGVWIAENCRFGMMAVYVPCLLADQLVFWQSLVTLLGSLDLPVCCGGEFNVVLSVAERRNCLGDGRRMVAFKEFFEELGILDLPASGCKFTWLISGTVDWGPRPFRFLNCWLEKPSHVQLMGKEWDRISSMVMSSILIMDKLRSLKSFLKVWNRESFGSVDLQIEVSTELINDLDE
ncbi:hypothetical protein V6N13_113836 [Hibiscus sabdariffa]